ncbi:STAS domain-containing protein [Propionivibrio limicola]|uniref:STAS domain-containing protein n=1 Tax=Propionivibrio limicola TaxID=167645 RepID=UPI001292A6EC|nr:STAS domain-containing protein [Propionivibrio limicola]
MAEATSPDLAVPALCILGDFTIFAAADLKPKIIEAINQGETDEVVIDLADVSEIDSAGLQLMVMAMREGAAQSKNVRFTRHSEPVLNLIDLFGLSGFFGTPALAGSTH